jgi:branched-chain amino acid transport system permease protein
MSAPIRGLVIVAAVLGLALPVLIGHPYVFQLAILALIWALLGSSWDLLSGYTGQISFGHAGLYAFGAYFAAYSNLTWRLSPPAGVVAAALLTGALGFAVGFPALRLRGHYLALTTLGFGAIIELTATNWVSVTGGPFGLTGFKTFADYAGAGAVPGRASYLIVLAFTLALFAAMFALIRFTGAGKAFRSIREDEVLAQALGINTTYYKLLAFAVSAGGAGAAGALYAYHIGLVSPSVAAIWTSAMVVGMAVFGGIGTLWGPFVGAILLFGITEGLRFVGVVYNLIALGLVMIVFVIFLPRGLAGVRWPRRGLETRKDAKPNLAA